MLKADPNMVISNLQTPLGLAVQRGALDVRRRHTLHLFHLLPRRDAAATPNPRGCNGLNGCNATLNPRGPNLTRMGSSLRHFQSCSARAAAATQSCLDIAPPLQPLQPIAP